MSIDLQWYTSGRGVEVGRGDYDRLRLLQHPECVTTSLFEETPICESSPDFVGVDARELPFMGDYFDFVASSHVLEHMLDPLSVLHEWKRVLKVGGFLILAVPEKDNCQYPDGVYLDRHRLRSSLKELLVARGKTLPKGRPKVEYIKNEDNVNEFGDWVQKWTGTHHWAWKLPDIVFLVDYVSLEVVEAKYPHIDRDTFCVVGKKVC